MRHNLTHLEIMHRRHSPFRILFAERLLRHHLTLEEAAQATYNPHQIRKTFTSLHDTKVFLDISAAVPIVQTTSSEGKQLFLDALSYRTIPVLLEDEELARTVRKKATDLLTLYQQGLTTLVECDNLRVIPALEQELSDFFSAHRKNARYARHYGHSDLVIATREIFAYTTFIDSLIEQLKERGFVTSYEKRPEPGILENFFVLASNNLSLTISPSNKDIVLTAMQYSLEHSQEKTAILTRDYELLLVFERLYDYVHHNPQIFPAVKERPLPLQGIFFTAYGGNRLLPRPNSTTLKQYEHQQCATSHPQLIKD